VDGSFDARWRTARPIGTGETDALWGAIAHPPGSGVVLVPPQSVAGGTEEGIFLGQPEKALDPPDTRVLIPKPCHGDERGDPLMVKPQEVFPKPYFASATTAGTGRRLSRRCCHTTAASMRSSAVPPVVAIAAVITWPR
jgi:hypothetical protein